MSDIIKIYANELFYISYYTFEFILKENKKNIKIFAEIKFVNLLFSKIKNSKFFFVNF